jgi:hypothetical protein
MSDDEVTRTAFVASSVMEADVVRGLLEANGIPAIVVGGDMAAMLDGMVSGNKGVSVDVPASHLEEARRVIEENHTPVADDDEDFEEEDAED